MNKRHFMHALMIGFSLLFGLTACLFNTPEALSEDLDEVIETALQETMMFQTEVDQAVQETVEAALSAAQDTPTGEAEPTRKEDSSTPTLSPTLKSTSPMVSVSENTNCRTGTNSAFTLVGILMVGEEAEIIGVARNGGYYYIQLPDNNGKCWLWDYYASTSGNLDSLTVMDPPATPTITMTPTPSASFKGNWDVWLDLDDDLTLCDLYLNQSGKKISGDVECEDDTYSLYGEIQEDQVTVYGTGDGDDMDFSFTIRILSAGGQFSGNYRGDDDSGAFCGALEGYSKPGTCYGP